MSCNFLITGASGFLGNAITNHLVLQHSKFLTIGRHASNQIICDLSLEVPQIASETVDVVIHAAGKAHTVPKTTTEKQAFFEVNLIGTSNLLKALENLNQLPKSFVYISSVAVYMQETGLNIAEKAPLQDKDSYGLSKIKAEQLVIDWCNKNNLICTILRLPLLVGENPPGNLGAMIKGVKKGYYFNIAGGQARKSMVMANDVAKILVKASEIGGVYNLTDGYHPNFYELSSAIANYYDKSRIFNMPFFLAKNIALLGDFIGNKFPLDSKKLRKITSDLTFDDTKARKFLEWNPQKVLDYYKNKDMIFEQIQNELESNQFEIVSMDLRRPWGGFFVIAEEQAQEFSNQYFDGLEVSTLKRGGALSPKILVVAPEKRLSWQYHHRRAEIWRVIQGQAGVKRSSNDAEGELEILNVGDTITLQQGERHRLIGLDDYAVIAEIWQHTDADHPSDEDDIVRVQDDFGR